MYVQKEAHLFLGDSRQDFPMDQNLICWLFFFFLFFRVLDFINIMCYDFHQYNWFFPFTGYNAPLYPKTWRERPALVTGNTVSIDVEYPFQQDYKNPS